MRRLILAGVLLYFGDAPSSAVPGFRWYFGGTTEIMKEIIGRSLGV